VRLTFSSEETVFAMKKLAPAILIASTLAFGLSVAPATAQQNRQRGLVNVAVFEVIDDVNVVVEDVNVAVGVAANIAANVCGVAVPVAVLAQQVVAGAGEFSCTNDAGDTGVDIRQQ
jgi:hypothetical protein